MTVRIVIAGVTGWTGSALVKAVVTSADLELVAGVARASAGKDAGEANGLARAGATVFATLEEALVPPSDVVVDYTHPAAVKGHTLTALAAGRHVDGGSIALDEHTVGRIETDEVEFVVRGRAEEPEEVVEDLRHEVPAGARVPAEAVVLPRACPAAHLVTALEDRHIVSVAREERRQLEGGDAASARGVLTVDGVDVAGPLLAETAR